MANWGPATPYSFPASILMRFDQEPYIDTSDGMYVYTPRLSHWLYYGSGSGFPGAFGLGFPNPGDDLIGFQFDYELQVTDPNPDVRLDQFSLRLDRPMNFQYNISLMGVTQVFYDYRMTIRDLETGELAFARLGNDNAIAPSGGSLEGFQDVPVNGRHFAVSTTIFAWETPHTTLHPFMNSFFHEMRLVPEPTAPVLLAGAFYRRRRRRPGE